MKNLFKLFPIAAVAVSSFFFMGCPQDPCVAKKITCANAGTCLEGICTCAAGYDGELCETVSRTKFVGAGYLVSETCTGQTGTTNYSSDITVDAAGITGIKIKNLGNYTCLAGTPPVATDYYVPATVNGSKITIAGTACGTTFSGTGTYSKSTAGLTTVTITYKATYTVAGVAKEDNCVATYLK